MRSTLPFTVPALTRRIAVESAPAALALVCWGLLVRISPPALQGPLTLIALVMAFLYAASRGRVLASSAPSDRMSANTRELLVENLLAGLAAGVWLLAAALVYVLRGLWTGLGIPGAFTDPSNWLSSAFGGAALVAVVIYAVARWTAMERAEERPRSDTGQAPDRSPSGAPSDD